MRNHPAESRWRKALALTLFAIPAIAPLAMAQQHKAQPPKSLRLYVIDCGSLDIPDTSPYQFKKEDLVSSVIVGAVLSGGASQRNLDVGYRSGSRQRFQARRRPRDDAICDLHKTFDRAAG
jgi:hypothetical protein